MVNSTSTANLLANAATNNEENEIRKRSYSSSDEDENPKSGCHSAENCCSQTSPATTVVDIEDLLEKPTSPYTE